MDSYLEARASTGQLYSSVYELFPQALYGADPLPPIVAKQLHHQQVEIEYEDEEPLDVPTFYYNVNVHASQLIPQDPAPRQPTVEQRKEAFVQLPRDEAQSAQLAEKRQEVEALRLSEASQRAEIEQLKAQNKLLFEQRDPAIAQREAEEKRRAEEEAVRLAAEERRRLAEQLRLEEERRLRELQEQQLRKEQEARERERRRVEYYRNFDIDLSVFRYYNPASMHSFDLYRLYRFASSDPALIDWSALLQHKLRERSRPLLTINADGYRRQLRRALDPKYSSLHRLNSLVGKLHYQRRHFIAHRAFPSNVTLVARHSRLAGFWEAV